MSARPLSVRLLASVEQWLHADALPATQFKKAVRKQAAAAETLRTLITRAEAVSVRLQAEGFGERQAAAVQGALDGLVDRDADFRARRHNATVARTVLRVVIARADAAAPARPPASQPASTSARQPGQPVGHERKDLFG